MSDLSDVLNSLVNAVYAAVYPNGINQPPVFGTCITIFPGWPTPAQLAANLAAGTCSVSVYPRPEERNTTRYPLDWQTVSQNTPTLTLTSVGQVVTIAGTIPPTNNPHNAVIFVNAKPYVYAVQSTDTLSGIAAALAALIAADVAGTVSSGVTVVLPSTARLGAVRIGVTGQIDQEIRRQERLFQIGIWANIPQQRDAVAQAIDIALAQLRFLTLPDGYAARIIYKGSPMSDAQEKSALFRRDLLYTVEYATTLAQSATQVTQTELTVSEASTVIATVFE